MGYNVSVVETDIDFNQITLDVEDRGFDFVEWAGGEVLEELIENLARHGIGAIRNSSGGIATLTRYSAGAAGAAGTTAAVNLAKTGVSLAKTTEGVAATSAVASSAEAGGAVIGVGAASPAVIVLAVLAAAGLAVASFDIVRSLTADEYGQDFDWGTDSVGGKILCYFDKNANVYIDEETFNNIKQKLIDIGCFDSGVLEPYTDYTFPSTFSLDFDVMTLYDTLDKLADCLNPNPYGSYHFTATQITGWINMINYVKNDNENISDCIIGCCVEASGYNSLQVHYTPNRTITNSILSSSSDIRIINNFNFSEQDMYYQDNPFSFCNFNFDPNFVEVTHLIYDFEIDSNTGVITNVTKISSPDSFTGGDFEKFWGLNLCPTGQGGGGYPGVEKQPNAEYPDEDGDLPTWNPDKIFIPVPVPVPTPTPGAPDFDIEPKPKIKIKLPDKDPDTDLPDIDLPQDERDDPTSQDTLDDVIKDGNDTIPDNTDDPKLPDPEDVPDLPDFPDIPDLPNPDVDIGVTPPLPVIPPIVIPEPTGVEDTGLIGLYNPTREQVLDFTSWLWSNDFFDNLEKIFANPMDAVIGLSIVYVNPIITHVNEPIVCGWLTAKKDGANIVSNTVKQYRTVDCGTMKITPYFNNILDYNPYTSISIYLPFIGIKELDTNEVMNSTLHVFYNCDVATGTCLANIEVTRGDMKSVLYKYAGNCAVQVPLSGGTYAQLISNCISLATSSIAGGGIGAAMGAVSAITSSKLSVERSGSLGANAGAMDTKTPYIIITRPIRAEAANFNNYYGYPTNKTIKLSNCNEFTRVKEVNIKGINATDDELNEIDNLLKGGVFV